MANTNDDNPCSPNDVTWDPPTMPDIDINPDTNKPNEGMISVLVVEPRQGVNEDSDQVAINENPSEAAMDDFEQKVL